MNTPVQIEKYVPYREYPVGEGVDVSFSKMSVQLHEENNIVYIRKEDAIELAKNILIQYDVPFANRVKGAGVAK